MNYVMTDAILDPLTIPDLIDRLGGTSALARKGGWPVPTVNAWKHRRTVPLENWDRLIDVAKQDGVPLTAEHLLAAHRESRKEGDVTTE